ncbi:hypothetical protein BGW80DRAFT_223390 [Lactifluus volemus]|nr:hypothetical protein BGW80DRAFT_223390 [Lactifluus volemus]
MGVLGLTPFLQKAYPQVISQLHSRLKSLSNKTLVIDGTLVTQRFHFSPMPHEYRHVLDGIVLSKSSGNMTFGLYACSMAKNGLSRRVTSKTATTDKAYGRSQGRDGIRQAETAARLDKRPGCTAPSWQPRTSTHHGMVA